MSGTQKQMMPSLKKKVVGFIRQLSVNNQSENVPSGLSDAVRSSGCFIQRYLSGHDVRGNEPFILHGRNPQELPVRILGSFATGLQSIIAAYTGPDRGLTSVNLRQRHFSTSDPDVDFIDILDHAEHERKTVSSSDCIFSRSYDRWFNVGPPVALSHPIDNSVMHIRAAGSVFSVGKKSVHTSVSDLQSSVTDNPYITFDTKICPPENLECPDNNIVDIRKSGNGAMCNYNEKHSSLKQRSEEKDSIAELNGNDSRLHLQPKSLLTSDNSLSPMEDSNLSSLEDCVIPPPAEYASVCYDVKQVGFAPIRKSKSAPPPLLACGNVRSKMFGKVTYAHNRADDIAGVSDWFCGQSDAYGAATTLYERHPITNENAGNPIADCFAVVARENSAVLTLADGVNWGEKACVAARSAVHGCIEYLNKALFSPGEASAVTSTSDVFVALLRSFQAAHTMILQEEGMLTTLTTAVVLPLKDSENYIVCVCNVGDSLAYIYSPEYGVREITKGSHDIYCMRDMRDALGALGPVDGQNPELNNLTCSMTEAKEGDIVFITSDGVSDNFDPVVGKFAVLPPSLQNEDTSLKITHPMKLPSNSSKQAINSKSTVPNDSGLPVVDAFQRHELSLLRIEDLLNNGVTGNGPPCSDAKTLCEMLLDFAIRLTAAKRHILEDPDLYYTISENSAHEITELSRAEQRTRRKKVCEKLAMVPGKLDHATVVAYKVGVLEKTSNFQNEECKVRDKVLLDTVL